MHDMKALLVNFAILFSAMSAFSATYYVKPDGDDNKDGKSWANAFKTANKGFSTINITDNRGSTLVIAPGEYPLTSAIGCNGGGSEAKRSHVRSSTDNPEDVVI